MTDPIADMLNRIRNAQAVSHPTVNIPFSKIKYKIAKILEKEGFIEGATTKGRKKQKIVRITLKYVDNIPVISGLKRVSKPGQRIYLPYDKIKQVKGGYGLAIISTPKGLMSGEETRRKKLGGEVICEVW